jgi:RHS repeat-associated protein
VYHLSEGASLTTTLAWRGKRQDITGFYWMGARYYESVSGRFLSPDPFGHGASMSLYDYAGGDPVNFVDPTGRLQTMFQAQPGSFAKSGSIQMDTSMDPYLNGNFYGKWSTMEHIVNQNRIDALNASFEATKARMSYIGSDDWNRDYNGQIAARNMAYFDSMLSPADRFGYTVAEYAAPLIAGGLQIGIGLTPWLGDLYGTYDDVTTLGDSTAPGWARGIAGVSLALNAYTLGAAPNAAPIMNGLETIADIGNRGGAPSPNSVSTLFDQTLNGSAFYQVDGIAYDSAVALADVRGLQIGGPIGSSMVMSGNGSNVMVAHGDLAGTFADLQPNELADVIRQQGPLPKSLELIGCWSAESAQQLAPMLGIPVKGYHGPVNVIGGIHGIPQIQTVDKQLLDPSLGWEWFSP